jgi:uncharacterized protein YcbK (DUF882 family)
MLDWLRWPNFTEGEFRCRCGCGRADMDPAFMDRLQALRERFGKPLRISSGYRCPDHNARVSSTGRGGPHITGKAVDVAVAYGDVDELERLAVLADVSGRGVQQKPRRHGEHWRSL